jgi:hypothetical protein
VSELLLSGIVEKFSDNPLVHYLYSEVIRPGLPVKKERAVKIKAF